MTPVLEQAADLARSPLLFPVLAGGAWMLGGEPPRLHILVGFAWMWAILFYAVMTRLAISELKARMIRGRLPGRAFSRERIASLRPMMRWFGAFLVVLALGPLFDWLR